jgi:predicted dinucleotide-binding enzyme
MQLPEQRRVVKAFNTTFAVTLAAGDVAGQQLPEFQWNSALKVVPAT